MKDTSIPVFVIGGSVTVVFPAVTALVYTAGFISLPNATDTSILAASATRRSLEIFNPTGATPLFLAFGGAAAVASSGVTILTGQSWSHDPLTILAVCQQEIRGIQSSGGAVVMTFVSGV